MDGFLWFGWFGFNAGSALAGGGIAITAFVDTHLATCAAVLTWCTVEWAFRGKPTTLGAASGAVAGLVAITPAAGFVGPVSAMLIGRGAGGLCYLAVLLKAKVGYDDSLDVLVGVQGMGGYQRRFGRSPPPAPKFADWRLVGVLYPIAGAHRRLAAPAVSRHADLHRARGLGERRRLGVITSREGQPPLVGDWNDTGTSKVGAFRPSDGTFYLDYNGSGTWEGCGIDRCLSIGLNGDIPLVGDWNASGTCKVGAFRPSDGTFYLDYNGSGQWEGWATDRCLSIGLDGDTPLVGKW